MLATSLFCGAKADAGPLSGAVFSASNYGVFVQDVSAGSPSDRAGLSGGDRVLSVNGESWFSIWSDFDRTLEMALSKGKSVVLEVADGSGKKRDVWLRVPALSVEDRRFLDSYLTIRTLWDGVLDLWESIKMDHKNAFLEKIPWDLAGKEALNKASELISIKNSMVRTIPRSSKGEAWNNINEAREKIASLIFLMDQETQRLFRNYDGPPGSRRPWKEPRTMKSGISEVEKIMACALDAAGFPDFE